METLSWSLRAEIDGLKSNKLITILSIINDLELYAFWLEARNVKYNTLNV